MGNCEIQEAPGSLVVTWRRGSGIGDVFLLIWLIGWTCGLIAVASKDWSASPLLALVPMGLAEVLVLGLYLQSVVGWDRLTFEPDKITFERWAVVTFHKRTIATANVNSIGLRPPDPTAEPYRTARLIIAASGNREIHFGKGLGLEELRRLLLYLQQRLDEQQTVFASRINPNVSASINNAICEANDADKPESLPVRILGWLTVPFFILGGYVFVIGGVAGIATGHPLAILFGLLFTGIGLVLSVGLTWSTIRVFRDWLHQRKAGTSPAPTNPQRIQPRQPPTAERDSLRARVPIEALLIAPVIVMTLYVRFRSLPSDGGGTFYHIWISVVAWAALAALLPQLRAAPRKVAAAILLPTLV
ncbi:MAG: hypothetical protein KDA51_11150, partial [Planctomycetales bacterium]|nr:hypothetical protein [Planctomycetales bacterium]